MPLTFERNICVECSKEDLLDLVKKCGGNMTNYPKPTECGHAGRLRIWQFVDCSRVTWKRYEI